MSKEADEAFKRLMASASVMSPDYQLNEQKVQNAGFLENFGSGVVNNVGDRALGLKAAAQRVFQDHEGAAQTTDRIKARQAMNSPLSMTWGGGLGKVASDLAPTLIPGANTTMGATTIGALMGASLTADNALGAIANTAVGGAAGYGGQRIGNFLANGPVAKSDSVGMQAAERIGYKPTPAQVSGNPMTASLENYLSRMPGSSGVIDARRNANQSAVNEAMQNAMGLDKTTMLAQGIKPGQVSEQAFNAADAARNATFQRLKQGTVTDLNAPNNPLSQALSSIEQQQIALAKHGRQNQAILDEIDKLRLSASQGPLDGNMYQLIREELQSSASRAFNASDNALGQTYKKLYKALDETVYDQLPNAAAKTAWKTAREQSGAYKTATKGAVVEDGNVSPARTASALRAFNADMYKKGQFPQQVMDVARVGEAFKPMANPNSGQIPAIQKMMENLPGAVGVSMPLNNILARMYMFEPNKASKLIAPLLQSGRPMAYGGLLGLPWEQQ